MLGGISPAGCQGWDGMMGWGSGEGIVSPCASPLVGRDLVWAALGHRSVAGEPADQHEVQVHQIHRPRHQPGADPHHPCYPTGHSLQEEGGHVSAKPGNQSPQIAPLCTGAEVYGGGKPANVGLTLGPNFKGVPPCVAQGHQVKAPKCSC